RGKMCLRPSQEQTTIRANSPHNRARSGLPSPADSPSGAGIAERHVMPRIKIPDSLGVELAGLSPNAGIASALNKYVKSPFVELLGAPDLLRDARKPLLTAAATPVAVGLTSKFPIALGSSGTELSIE